MKFEVVSMIFVTKLIFIFILILISIGVMREINARTYWKKNITYVLILLSIWFLVAYGCGIFWKEGLDSMRISGVKLGFWVAQQGSICIFIILIFVYVWLMNRLDKDHGIYEN